MSTTPAKSYIWLFGILAVFVAGVSWYAAGDSTLDLDLRITSALQRWQGNAPKALYDVADILGNIGLAAAGAIVTLILAVRKRISRIIRFLLILAVLRAAATLLKPIFASPRPSADQAILLQDFENYGYPSGHSLNITMTAAISIALAWLLFDRQRSRKIAMFCAFAMMALVGWSRIWAGAHWFTDVIAGWSFGIIIAIVAWYYSGHMVTKWPRWQATAADTPTPQ